MFARRRAAAGAGKWLFFVCCLGLVGLTVLSCREQALPPSRAFKLPPGAVARPEFFRKNVRVSVAGQFLVVQSDGLPDHATGNFPNRLDSNSIRGQRYYHLLPLVPVPASEPIPVPPGQIGIMVNGVLFKGPESGQSFHSARRWFQNVVQSGSGLDEAGGHPNARGEYHYHFYPAPLDNPDRNKHSSLIGFAFDGYPLYGPRGYADPTDPKSKPRVMRSSYHRVAARAADGPPVDAQHPLGMYVQDFEYAPEGKAGHGDLDECNGRFAVTPEFPQGIYHYHATVDQDGQAAFPYFPWRFHGNPAIMNLDRPPKVPGGP